MGFGIAVSGGRDNPNIDSGETSIIVSDVLQGGPADGLLYENDRVMQVNSIPMDNVPHSFAVQQLRKCGKVAKITVKRPRKVAVLKRPPSPDRDSRDYNLSSYYPEDNRSTHSDPDSDYPRGNGGLGYPRERNRSLDKANMSYLDPGYDAGRRERSRGRSLERSPSPDRGYRRDGSRGRTLERGGSPDSRYHRQHSRGDGGSPAGSYGRDPGPGYDSRRYEPPRSDDRMIRSHSRDRLQDHSPSPSRGRGKDWGQLEPLDTPINVLLVKNRPNEEYGLRLGSQIFIKEMTSTGLAARDGSLQEGDIILKINGTVTENLSLSDAGKLIEKSRGKLQLVVQRDHRQILVRIPALADSDSEPDDISEMESYHSYSPQEDQRSRQSDLSSHSSTEVPRENAREDPQIRLPKLAAPSSPYRGVEESAAVQEEPKPEEPPGKTQPTDMCDQVCFLQVNNVDFRGIVREEAVLFLLELPRGDNVTILAQSKPDVYEDILVSGRGDSFFIRTHFDYEKELPQCLAFCRGDIFKVVDTLYDGKLGNWLAVRVGKENQLLEKGIIPNKSRADQMTNVQHTHKGSGSDRADFWRMRGQRAAKKKDLRKNREDLSTGLASTRFPAYERVVLREAGFRRPVVLFGPIADAASEKLATELPDEFVVAKTEPKDAGSEKSSGVVRLNTIRQIIEQDKHALLDVTPKAVDTLNYTQWYPIVIFFNPDSKHGVKAMRQRIMPNSNRSARKLFDQALKLRKSCSHLFTGQFFSSAVKFPFLEIINPCKNYFFYIEKSSPEIRFHSRAGVASRAPQSEGSPPVMSTFLPDPSKVKLLAQGEASRGHYNPVRIYDHQSNHHEPLRLHDSPTKPPPPPVSLKPSSVSRTSRGPAESPPLRDHEPPDVSPEDPSKRSFMGKLRAFEKMDHIARAQRVLELQEAQNARVEIAQKHPDIYAVPIKAQKLDHSRPQPIGSSSRPEPQTPPSRAPYSENCPPCPGKEEGGGEEHRRRAADQSKLGYYPDAHKYQDTEL
uniref:Tight junction protein 2b (zona occludens 2) n=1 Tax=Astyanax mexicanus TaxID=7994 RepID=A0A8B9RDG3_ASTMX